MLNETLVSGLERYRIGAKIKALRLKKQLGLAQLGAHSGLSPALLSKIERSQIFPTLPTLLRIALVFGVGLDHFFVESAERPLVAVVRKKDRLSLPDHPDKDKPSYFFESLNFPVSDAQLQAFFADFPADAEPFDAHVHPGVEFLYVIKGKLVVTIADEDAELDAGDAIYFDSSAPHSYRLVGRHAASALVVTTETRR